MPIHFYAKPSMEKLRSGWVTTRFWVSTWALLTATGTAVWGAQHEQVVPMAAGALSAAIVAAVYVWAISREA
jgi:hypothetical protein